ncbi:MAG: BLUF domain-containing protein [Myxococcota bacterium]
MSFYRVVCLSSVDPTAAPSDILSVCHHYPSRKAQSDVGGRLLVLGQQYLLLLEGRRASVEGLVERIQAEAPGAQLTVRRTEHAAERAFGSWAIQDLYLDELAQRTPAAADRLGDVVIDLLATPPVEASDRVSDQPADVASDEVDQAAIEVDTPTEGPEEVADPFAEFATLTEVAPPAFTRRSATVASRPAMSTVWSFSPTSARP